MRLDEFRIDTYGPLSSICHECADEDIDVFYGPNESGKTLLVEALLQLLAPEVAGTVDGLDRVDEPPQGYVAVETADGERVFDGDDSLCDREDVTPRHLRNVFVVRDSDLRIPEEHDYYDSVAEQIGDLHTDEIDAVRQGLVDAGNLTRVDLNLEARGAPETKTIYGAATELADDLAAYVEAAEESDVEADERTSLEVRRELRDTRERREDLQAAKTLDRHEILSRRLEDYREAAAALEEATVSQDDLDELRDLDREIERLDDAIEETDEDLDRHQAALETDEDELSELETELEPLERRREDVDTLEADLTAVREADATALGSDTATRGLAAASLIALTFGGAAAVVGSLPLGVAFLLVGLTTGGLAYRRHLASKRAARDRAVLCERARDLGFDVDDLTDVAPAIAEFRKDLERLDERRRKLEQSIGVAERRLEDLESELSDDREARRQARESKRARLDEAGVASVGAYRERVAARSDHERDRNGAAQSLEDSLDSPETAASWRESADYWGAELDTLLADVNTDGITAEDHDPEALAAVEDRIAKLEGERDELDERLDDHEERLDEFERKLDRLSAEPYLGEPVELSARSVGGLREAHRGVTRLVEHIERSADVSREAIEILEAIKREEERKLTSLFEAGTTTDVFAAITEGRYVDVTYDPDARVLEVERDDGRVHHAGELSHGTTEQLYLATRLGLADQLMASRSGFFLMDDAFLPADEHRLQESFAVLSRLTAQGWQVLYFTAKPEVYDEVAPAFDCAVHELEQLEQ